MAERKRSSARARGSAGIILSHDTALAFWSNPLLPVRLEPLGAREAKRVLVAAGGSLHVRVLDGVRAHPLFDHLPAQLDVLVPTNGDRRITRRAVMHAWQTALPKGALCAIPELGSEPRAGEATLAVSSPEFTFLQMAQVLEDLELAELGFELCGGYAIAPDAPNGFVKRDPVTTPERLRSFLDGAESAPGILRARRAAKWLVAGAASPKESQLALLACLTRKRGGAGLPGPLLNCPMEVSGQVARVLGATEIVPDLYWPRARVVVEYDSRAFHEGMQPAEHDARKRNAYELMGLDVFTVTAGQATDAAALFGVYGQVAKRLGIRRAKPTAQMLSARAEAVRLLSSGARWPRWTDPALVAAE